MRKINTISLTTQAIKGAKSGHTFNQLQRDKKLCETPTGLS